MKALLLIIGLLLFTHATFAESMSPDAFILPDGYEDLKADTPYCTVNADGINQVISLEKSQAKMVPVEGEKDLVHLEMKERVVESNIGTLSFVSFAGLIKDDPDVGIKITYKSKNNEVITKTNLIVRKNSRFAGESSILIETKDDIIIINCDWKN